MNSNYNPLNLGIVLFLGCALSAHASNVYISDSSSGTILELGSDGSESVFASGLNNPAGLAFDRSGNLFVADSGNGTILRFNSNGSGSVFASGLNDPTGLAFDNSGNLYVANQGDGTIWQFGSDGNGSVFVSGLGLNVDPTYLSFDGSGNLYVSGTHAIEMFDANGNQSTIFSAFNYVYGLAADSSGDLYASLQNAGSITRVLGSGGPTMPLSYPFTVNPFQIDPAGLAFDGSGNLYATFIQLGAGGQLSDAGGAIMEFDSNGNGTVLATGLNGPEYIAVQNTLTVPHPQFVPEPSTWIMMIVGLVAFGSRRLCWRSFRTP